MAGLLGQIVSFWGLSVSVYYKNTHTAVLASLCYTCFFGIGLGSSMYAYIPEILPPSGVGLVMMIKWMLIGVSGKFVPLLIHNLGIEWTINLFVGMLDFPLNFFLFLRLFFIIFSDINGLHFFHQNMRNPDKWEEQQADCLRLYPKRQQEVVSIVVLTVASILTKITKS